MGGTWSKEKKYLCTENLLRRVKKAFRSAEQLSSQKNKISITDCLMSGLAVYGLKYPSLLQFDQSRHDEVLRHNLKSLYFVDEMPSDTYMRERLDEVDPLLLRRGFNDVFSMIQRNKVLESYTFLDGHYLFAVDGTGVFSSYKIHCEHCCEKHHRDGTITYQHQILGMCLIHPDVKEVIPSYPEPISKGDGATKNDCESNAAKRLLRDFKKDHPHLKMIVVQDALSANGPHIRFLEELNIRYIINVTPDGNSFLFKWLEGVDMEEHVVTPVDGSKWTFRFANEVPLNDANYDLKVNFLECTFKDVKGKAIRFTWITDIKLNKLNVYKIARGGRARWRIENETFNTLKNQGYEFEHNYGHGYKHLCHVFAYLMMLAFLIDQVQQRCCGLFQAALKKTVSRIALWERLRSIFFHHFIQEWSDVWNAIAYGFKRHVLTPDTS